MDVCWRPEILHRPEGATARSTLTFSRSTLTFSYCAEATLKAAGQSHGAARSGNERIAIDSYRDAIGYLGGDDPTTRRMLEGILAVEEEHADELADLLQGIPAKSQQTSTPMKAGKMK